MDNCITNTICCNGFEMDYFSFGKGSRTLVIIPGMSLKSVTPSAGIIQKAFTVFHEDFKVFVFDRIRVMPSGYTIYDMAEDTVQAMHSCGIGKACIYGASQGGMIAQEIAVNHPEMVESIVLASTLSRPNGHSVEVMDEWIGLAKKGLVTELNKAVFRRVYSPQYYRKYAKAFGVLEREGTAGELRKFEIMAQATKEFDIYDRLDKVHCPVMVSGVENDTVLGDQAVIDLADRLACKPLIYPGEGHAAYDEDTGFPEKLYNFFMDQTKPRHP